MEISKKREQITTLRAVLKANKNTTEVAINSMKARHEQEKQLIIDNVAKLRTELRKLQNDSATFAYIRSMLVSRVDMLTNQFEEKRKECKSLNEKMQTLEQVLRMAISQKLALTERLEALESGVSPEQSTSSKNSTGNAHLQNVKPLGRGRGVSLHSTSGSKAGIPARYAKNPRASDASYLKKAYTQNK